MTKPKDPRPLGAYVALSGTYSLAWVLGAATLRRRNKGLPRFSARDLIVFALATQHLSRLIAKDSVTAPIRAPFTHFVEAAGEGEVNEEVVGTGLRHAVGELLTCPYCLAQWVATGLVAGRIAVPNFTEAVTTVCALARVSDWLQLAYDHVKDDG